MESQPLILENRKSIKVTKIALKWYVGGSEESRSHFAMGLRVMGIDEMAQKMRSVDFSVKKPGN